MTKHAQYLADKRAIIQENKFLSYMDRLQLLKVLSDESPEFFYAVEIFYTNKALALLFEKSIWNSGIENFYEGLVKSCEKFETRNATNGHPLWELTMFADSMFENVAQEKRNSYVFSPLYLDSVTDEILSQAISIIGALAKGCFTLITKEDFASRSDFFDPEQMTAIDCFLFLSTGEWALNANAENEEFWLEYLDQIESMMDEIYRET